MSAPGDTRDDADDVEVPRDVEGLAALEARLRRRFRVVETEVTVDDERVGLLHPADAEELISETDFERDERLPYWADVWPSAHVLATHVRGLRGAGYSLLELGCGAGLVSVCAARAGFDVTATDYYVEACEFTAVNVWRDGRPPVRARHVDWRALPYDLGHHDFVVASDVLYEPAHARLVARAIRLTLRRGGKALIADPGRIAAPAFLQEAASVGLEVGHLARVPFETGTARQHIDIHTLRRP